MEPQARTNGAPHVDAPKLPPAETAKEYMLAVEEAEMLMEFGRAIQDLNQQSIGALRMICKANKLTGNWSLSPDQTKLIRQG